MSRILVTGSADGLGRATAATLLSAGHEVIVHVRNERRASAVTSLVDRGANLIIADLANRSEVLNAAGKLTEMEVDAIIHNAGIYSGPDVMPVNVVAPYLLTALVNGPRRHVYLSSGMHTGGRPTVDSIDWKGTRTTGSYSDSKLFVTTLSAAVARLFPSQLSNAVDPGWVPTRMGGPDAPDNLEQGHRTQEWLATSNDPDALNSGGYWHHHRLRDPHPATLDAAFQDRLLGSLEDATGVALEPK